MHRSLWLPCSCECKAIRDHLYYNKYIEILCVHLGFWAEPRLQPTVSISWYRVLKMPLKLLSDTSAHRYWAQVTKYKSASTSVCTPRWKKTGSLLCATAAIQSQDEWLGFWESDSSRRISARISFCSIAMFYLLHLQCHPSSPLNKLTVRAHHRVKTALRVLALWMFCWSMGNLYLLMEQSQWLYFAVAFC